MDPETTHLQSLFTKSAVHLAAAGPGLAAAAAKITEVALSQRSMTHRSSPTISPWEILER